MVCVSCSYPVVALAPSTEIQLSAQKRAASSLDIRAPLLPGGGGGGAGPPGAGGGGGGAEPPAGGGGGGGAGAGAGAAAGGAAGAGDGPDDLVVAATATMHGTLNSPLSGPPTVSYL